MERAAPGRPEGARAVCCFFARSGESWHLGEVQIQGAGHRGLMFALALAVCGGWALGCRDMRKAAEDIAREDPATPKPAVAAKPGDGAAKPGDGAAKSGEGEAPKPVAPPAAKAAANDDDGDAPPDSAKEPDLGDDDTADEGK